MERWDIYNIDRQKTGRTMIRGEKMARDDYHLVAHVCLFNERGEMLIQQRSANKSTWANRWDLTVGGSALSGETSRDAAQRELREELGVEYDFSDLTTSTSLTLRRRNFICRRRKCRPCAGPAGRRSWLPSATAALPHTRKT